MGVLTTIRNKFLFELFPECFSKEIPKDGNFDTIIDDATELEVGLIIGKTPVATNPDEYKKRFGLTKSNFYKEEFTVNNKFSPNNIIFIIDQHLDGPKAKVLEQKKRHKQNQELETFFPIPFLLNKDFKIDLTNTKTPFPPYMHPTIWRSRNCRWKINRLSTIALLDETDLSFFNKDNKQITKIIDGGIISINNKIESIDSVLFDNRIDELNNHRLPSPEMTLDYYNSSTDWKLNPNNETNNEREKIETYYFLKMNIKKRKRIIQKKTQIHTLEKINMSEADIKMLYYINELVFGLKYYIRSTDTDWPFILLLNMPDYINKKTGNIDISIYLDSRDWLKPSTPYRVINIVKLWKNLHDYLWKEFSGISNSIEIFTFIVLLSGSDYVDNLEGISFGTLWKSFKNNKNMRDLLVNSLKCYPNQSYGKKNEMVYYIIEEGKVFEFMISFLKDKIMNKIPTSLLPTLKQPDWETIKKWNQLYNNPPVKIESDEEIYQMIRAAIWQLNYWRRGLKCSNSIKKDENFNSNWYGFIDSPWLLDKNTPTTSTLSSSSLLNKVDINDDYSYLSIEDNDKSKSYNYQLNQLFESSNSSTSSSATSSLTSSIDFNSNQIDYTDNMGSTLNKIKCYYVTKNLNKRQKTK